jgi:L-arabinonolactonase
MTPWNPLLGPSCHNQLGEFPLWDSHKGVLWWTNIHGGEIWRRDPFSSQPLIVMKAGRRVGALGPRGTSGLVVAIESGSTLFDSKTGAMDEFVQLEPDLSTTRSNDGRVEPACRFVRGGMDDGAPQWPLSGLYSLDRHRVVRRVMKEVSCANSICWSGDGRTIWFTDMPSRRFEAFNYHVPTGDTSNRRLFASLANDPGLADGSIVDAEDHRWNAQWDGHKIVRNAPNGAVDREFAAPVSNPTCLCLGGGDLDVVFIICAPFGLTESQYWEQSFAGGVFAFRPGIKGRAESRYVG